MRYRVDRPETVDKASWDAAIKAAISLCERMDRDGLNARAIAKELHYLQRMTYPTDQGGCWDCGRLNCPGHY